MRLYTENPTTSVEYKHLPSNSTITVFKSNPYCVSILFTDSARNCVYLELCNKQDVDNFVGVIEAFDDFDGMSSTTEFNKFDVGESTLSVIYEHSDVVIGKVIEFKFESEHGDVKELKTFLNYHKRSKLIETILCAAKGVKV
jgi:hypothetical protein